MHAARPALGKQELWARMHKKSAMLCCAVCRRVADLFQSVQLNVNNPHFLIMQGRVTKVSSSGCGSSSSTAENKQRRQKQQKQKQRQ
jgi:hypothetical protein